MECGRLFFFFSEKIFSANWVGSILRFRIHWLYFKWLFSLFICISHKTNSILLSYQCVVVVIFIFQGATSSGSSIKSLSSSMNSWEYCVGLVEI